MRRDIIRGNKKSEMGFLFFFERNDDEPNEVRRGRMKRWNGSGMEYCEDERSEVRALIQTKYQNVPFKSLVCLI